MQSINTSAGDRRDSSAGESAMIGGASAITSGMSAGYDRVPDAMAGTADSFRLLLALDDDSVARAASRVTAALARSRGAVPTVLKVIEVNTYCTPDSFPELTNAEELVVAVDAHHEYRDELRARVSSLVGQQVDWQARLDVGNDVQHIVRRAQDMDAELIIMGREHHGALWRALVGDTVRQVVTTGVAPVLAVARNLESLPRHVVVGIDFSVSSIRAAQWARRLLHPEGMLELVYVAADGPFGAGADGVPAAESNQVLVKRIERDMERLVSSLELLPGMRAVTVRRSGNAGEQLCLYADSLGADLIAVGSHRYKFLERLSMGSVSAAVLYHAGCSVLVAPPEPS